ncbi:hypothetical protein D3C71_1154930 [compost metagenome]
MPLRIVRVLDGQGRQDRLVCRYRLRLEGRVECDKVLGEDGLRPTVERDVVDAQQQHMLCGTQPQHRSSQHGP